MNKQRFLLIFTSCLILATLFFGGPLRLEAHATSVPARVPSASGQHGKMALVNDASPLGHISRPTYDHFDYKPGFIRPEFQQRMHGLRPVILASAKRHNVPELSGMSDTEFATVIALLLYNEHNGWFEDAVTPVRAVTPLYQQFQIDLNKGGLGGNFSVWPANLRPSVALEILKHQLPVPGQAAPMTVPVRVYGTKIDLHKPASREELLAQITAEISSDDMAVEYLAANLQRGLYRAQYEGVPVSWRTLAAWHNQGLVRTAAIQQNATAKQYVQRSAAYLEAARQIIEEPPLSTRLPAVITRR